VDDGKEAFAMDPKHLAFTEATRWRRMVFSAVLLLTLSAHPRVSLGQTSISTCLARQLSLIQASKPLSQCLSERGRDANIGQGNCTSVYVDKSYTGTANALGTITISPGGTLFVPDRTLALETAATRAMRPACGPC